MVWPFVENFRRLPLRIKIRDVILTIAFVNVVVYFASNFFLGGQAITGRIENGHYFVFQSYGPLRSAESHYTEVGPWVFYVSLVMGGIFWATLLAGFVWAYTEYFKFERTSKAQRAAASDAGAQKRTRPQ